MAKEKTKKNYTIKVEGGRLTLQMLEKDSRGLYRSMSVPFPYYENELVNNKWVMVKKTRKQVEKMILEHFGYKA